ncbi:MAG: hypothetical protein KatS3mg115_1084 [Candidatus Poribacteria bacterium]|nr:MAG: hypothetical protein KatS3mg115_1084 [Candidatus Poribacteria bacterium]
MGLFLLALGLRTVRLGTWSFWADEVFTVRDALRFPHELTINPLPYALVALALQAFGVTEWSARVFPMLAGVGSVLAVYWIGARERGAWAGRFAGLFTALLPWHLFWSQNARHYSFVFLFAVLSAWAFHRALEQESLRAALFALLFLGIMILSHFLAGALLVGLGLYLLLGWRGGWLPRRWAPPSLVIVGPFLAGGLIVLGIPAVRAYLFSGWGRTVWARSPLYVLATFAAGATLPILTTASFGLLCWRGIPSTTSDRWLRLLSCLVVGPLAFFLLASLVQNVAGYYLFALTPFVLLLAGEGCAWAFRQPGRSPLRWLPVLLVVAGLLHGLVDYFFLEHGGRPRWKEALRELQPHLNGEDFIWMTLPDVGRYYLAHPPERILKITHADLAAPERLLGAPAGDSSGAVYVVVDANNFDTVDPSRRVRAWIDRHGERIVFVFGYARGANRSIEVYRLRKSP